MVPSLRVRLPLSTTVDGARIAVGRRSLTASWLSRSEEARPWTARGPALTLLRWVPGAAIPPSSHQPSLLRRGGRQQDHRHAVVGGPHGQGHLALAVQAQPY